MLTLLMAFIVGIVTWAGNVAIAYARSFLISGPHSPGSQSHSAWCFLCIVSRGSCFITSNKRTANHPETRFILLFCQPAVAMGDNLGLAAPPCFVVQVSPGCTGLRMD